MSRPDTPPGINLHASGRLVERALELLREGALSTSALAEQVLHTNGELPAASRAVWTLLADDPRFTVDGAGVWAVRSDAPPAREAGAKDAKLRDQPWAVVDVETTGGSPARGHRVTEVAVVHVTGGEVGEIFSTLVHPDRRIPRAITALTGIDDGMVAGAPRFTEIVPRVADTLRGRVFVAHHAPFDWRFISAEFDRAIGRVPAGRRLCTVRLARKLLPELPSRSLDALATFFDLRIAARHRAADDAVATAHLLLRLIEMLEEREIRDWSSVEALLRQRAPRRKRSFLPRSMDSA